MGNGVKGARRIGSVWASRGALKRRNVAISGEERADSYRERVFAGS